MIVNWILSRLVQDDDGRLEIHSLYENFKFEHLESQKNTPLPSQIIFTEHVKALFPDVQRVRIKTGTSWQILYRGISIRPLAYSATNTLSFEDISKTMPESYYLKKSSSEEIICEKPSGCMSNGHSVNKSVVLHDNRSWDLIIGGKKVDLSKVFIDNKFNISKESLKLVFTIVDKVQLCGGVKVSKSVSVSRFHTLDLWQTPGDNAVRSVRSLLCLKIIPLNSRVISCRVCQKMTFSSEGKENLVRPIVNAPEPKPVIHQIKQLFPQANDNMIELLLEQAKNVGRHPKGRRWSQKFIGVCLQMYNRSPHCYEILSESKLLILPSKSLLILYKNSIKQKPGFDDDIFHWMYSEANRQNIPEGERYGGIIFDEMSIQTDMQLDKKGDIIEISGFTDYGKEGDSCHALRQGTKEKCLGKYVLQLLFLGTSGFRFPFAHFITNGAQASELFGLFWKAVYMLYSAGFTVLYTCMDGAQANRSLMHMCLGNKPDNFIARNPCTFTDVIFLMDYSHVIKKIRNNILKSGNRAGCTRILTLPSDHTIHWQMFIDFYNWDQQNALQIHRKLTQEHFFLDSQLKMRNHLAEDVLNSEMLNSMKIYQQSLGEKGQVLNGLIEFIQNTSQLVDIFRDMRPIRSHDDIRLSTLKSVSNWFSLWQTYIMNNSEIPEKEKRKKLLSQQCMEDIQSCIQGFIALSTTVLQKSCSTYITPGIVNSDVIENVFNQQRSTYHGANSNPNALQYQRAINSVLVGQNVVSKKSNAGKTKVCTVPYSLALKQPLRKRKSDSSSASSASDFKCIRL